MTIDKREKVLVPINLDGGMNEAVADEVAGTNSLKVVENAYYDVRGKLSKRHGVTSLGNGRLDGSSRSAGRHMDTYRDTVVIFDGEKGDIYTPTANTCVSLPAQMLYDIEAYPIVGGSGTPQQFQSIQVNGYIVCAYYYSDSDDVVGCVLDETTREVVVQSTGSLFGLSGVGVSNVIRLATANNNAHIIACDMTAGTMDSVYIDTTNASTLNTGFQTGLAETDFDTSGASIIRGFDAASNATNFFVAYPENTGTYVTVTRYDDTGTEEETTNVSHGVLGISCVMADDLWVAMSDGSTSNIVVLDDTDLTTTVASGAAGTAPGGQFMGFSIGKVNGTSCTLVQAGSENTNYIQVSESGGSLSNVFSEGTVEHWHAISRPFTIADTTHVVMRHSDADDSNVQGEKTFVVANVSTNSTLFAPISGVFATRLGEYKEITLSAGNFHLPMQHIHDTSDGFMAGLFPRRKLAKLEGTDDGVGFDYVVFTRDPEVFSLESVEHADGLYVSAGVTEVFDGIRFAEVNFVAPPAVTFAEVTSGGNVNAGTYLITTVFEYVDAAGNVHWSEPSETYTFTAGGNNRIINVDVRSLTLTNKTSDSDDTARNQIVVYRTAASGTTFYRSASVRDTGADQTIQDNVTDDVLITKQKLYTQPGTPGTSLGRQCPPSSKHMVGHQDRIWCDDETGIRLWYSAPRVIGEAAWFNNLFTIPIEEGGRITGLASFDNRLIVFKRDAIYVISGQGPPENGGSGNEFSPPYRLPTDIGCIEHKSITVADDGIFFHANQGIMKLNRRLQVEWIGEPIKELLETYPHVVTAIAYTDDRIAFSLRANETIGTNGTGCIAIYHTKNRAWAVYYIQGDDGTNGIGIEDMEMLELSGEQRAWLLDPEGNLYVSRASGDASRYYDSVDIVRMAVETNWIRTQQSLSDRQRVYNAEVVLRMKSNVSVNTSFAYDYNNTFSDEDQTDETVLGSSGIAVVKKQPDTPQNMAVKFRVVETANVNAATLGTGEGFDILGIAIEVAGKSGAHDPSADNKG